MKEKLTIRNFAGIKSIDLSLGEINVLIGPQSSGKSICAKTLYYFKSFLNDLVDAGEEDLTKREFDRSLIKKFDEYFPNQNLGASDFSLRYDFDEIFITVERSGSKLKLEYSDFLAKEFIDFKQLLKKIISERQESGKVERFDRYQSEMQARRLFFNKVKSKAGSETSFSQIFIPAGRSFFSILQSSIFSFLSSNKAVDPFMVEFGSFYESIKSFSTIIINGNKDKEELAKIIDKQVSEVLGGKYHIDRGKDYLLLDDGRRISLANSSSGQQEILPLAIILRTIPFLQFIGEGYSVYIEEPEAHLFPSSQRKIVELIATIYNKTPYPSQFVITTHSPYILTAFNNLLHAGNISNQIDDNRKQKLKKIVPEEQWLNSNHVCVYSLHDGIAQCIKSKETGLISTNILDQVSDELGAQFDKLIDIS